MDHRVFGVVNDGQLVWNHSEACGCYRRIEAAREYAPRASRPTKRLIRIPLSVLLFFSAKAASRERQVGEASTRTLVVYGTGLMALGLVLLFAAGCRRQSPATAFMENKEPAARVWPSEPPPGCPFPSSNEITGIAFTGRHREYENADTWYMSWASDGNLYSPYADGSVEGIEVASKGPSPTTGQAVVIGDDPLVLTVKSLGAHHETALPYVGRYPVGTLLYNGVWYYGTYAVEDGVGPMVGFRYSTDYGKTWTDPRLTPLHNLFHEGGTVDAKIKMAIPIFVDFGKNMEYSPDGKAYLVAHGATRPWVEESWIGGDQIYLARVTPSIANINDVSKYEFFSGYDAEGNPVWSGSFAKIRPLIEWNDHTGVVMATYDKPLKKFLMFVTRGPYPAEGPYDTYLLESERLTGPWKLITYMKGFGTVGYFVNIPSKFISPDGYTAWLCYSDLSNLQRLPTKPPGGRYALCLQEIKLVAAGR
jgi:hypothetical protein